MTAATVKEYVETGTPNKEVVILTLTDGETYTSGKFDLVRGARVSGNENNDAHINAVISGKTVTVNYAGMSDQQVVLTLYGVTGP